MFTNKLNEILKEEITIQNKEEQIIIDMYSYDYFMSRSIDAIFFKRFVEHNVKNKISIFKESVSIETKIEDLFFDKNLFLINIGKNFFGYHKTIENIFIFGYNDSKLNNIVNFDIYGEIGSVKKAISYFITNYKKKSSVSISWYFDPKTNDYISMTIDLSKIPCKEMYPYFNFSSLEEYYDAFNNSDENILILIGPPGTGKTTFIRGLLAHTKESASIVYDKNPLHNDSIFTDWFQSNEKYFIFEDSDQLLLPREEENDIMVKFLNIADGLISTKTKKFIFSTNLKNINQIDEALIRPGRCFDILEFRKLKPDEIKNLVCKLGLPEQDYEEEKTLAEIFSNSKQNKKVYFDGHKIPKIKFGFI